MKTLRKTVARQTKSTNHKTPKGKRIDPGIKADLAILFPPEPPKPKTVKKGRPAKYSTITPTEHTAVEGIARLLIEKEEHHYYQVQKYYTAAYAAHYYNYFGSLWYPGLMSNKF